MMASTVDAFGFIIGPREDADHSTILDQSRGSTTISSPVRGMAAGDGCSAPASSPVNAETGDVPSEQDIPSTPTRPAQDYSHPRQQLSDKPCTGKTTMKRGRRTQYDAPRACSAALATSSHPGVHKRRMVDGGWSGNAGRAGSAWDLSTVPLPASVMDDPGEAARPMTAEEWCLSAHAERTWCPDVSVQQQGEEDAPETDTVPGEPGARFRKWFARESTDPLDFGLLAWLRAGRVREYRQRGPRTNQGHQERLLQDRVDLYTLSPEELLALLYCNRFSPVTDEYLALHVGEHPTPDLPPADLAAGMRSRLPAMSQQLALAELSQASEEWGRNRALSTGSSSAATPAGWAYSDVYHLKVDQLRGVLGTPGFDLRTLYNFMHGHGRESEIRVAYRIVMGAWVGETGMLIDRDVWAYHPTAAPDRAAGCVAPGSCSAGLVEGQVYPRPRRHANGPMEEDERKNEDRPHGTWEQVRNSALWPEGHKHTSPDGIVATEPGIHHNCWFATQVERGNLTRFGLLEIKAPAWTVMQRRGANYLRRGWQKQPVLPPHIPISYYLFQVMDQLKVTGTWSGDDRAQWCDFTPMWMAHGRIGPKPFFFVEEVVRGRSLRLEDAAATQRWFVPTLEARKESDPHLWITGEMLVTRILRSEDFVRAMFAEYYAFYRDIRGNHPVPPKHHKPMQTPTGQHIPVHYLPLKQVIWTVHPTKEVPPVPCVWALDQYGLQPSEREVQMVTRPLTRHDTTYPRPPTGWPLDGSAWPNGYMTCYVVHFWEMTPMVDTVEDMYRL
jgi:hypothetical protein